MNTLKSIVVKPGSFGLKTILPLLVCAMTLPAFGQLRWSSYDTSGNLVAANVASGGDITTGNTVTFTIPANTELFFVTKGFTPFSLAATNAGRTISFKMSASGGLTGATAGQRVIGFGLFNSAGTPGFTDDVGYFGMFNAGNYTEPYYHSAGSGNLFSGTKPGQGHHHHRFPGEQRHLHQPAFPENEQQLGHRHQPRHRQLRHRGRGVHYGTQCDPNIPLHQCGYSLRRGVATFAMNSASCSTTPPPARLR